MKGPGRRGRTGRKEAPLSRGPGRPPKGSGRRRRCVTDSGVLRVAHDLGGPPVRPALLSDTDGAGRLLLDERREVGDPYYVLFDPSDRFRPRRGGLESTVG